jgi:hypothetical protein
MSPSAHLLLLPPWLAILLLMVGVVSFSIAGFLVVHRYVPVRVRRIHNDVAGFVFATLGATYGVLLAFVVVVVWEQFNDANVNKENESSTALVLYHNMAAYPDRSASGVMVAGLAHYARLASEEQEPLRIGQSSKDAALALDQLLTLFNGIVPDSAHEQILYAQILQNLNDLAKYRGLRLQAAREELPSVIWIGVVMGALITIGFTFLFGTENVWAHIIMMSLLAALIAVVVYVVTELDHPSMGSVSIGVPDGYAKILEITQSRQ